MHSIRTVLLSIATAALLPLISATPSPASPACYTHTVEAYPKACTADAGCFNIQCISLKTNTLPCPTAACAATPTVTKDLPCRTACRTGCATSTTHVVQTDCPKV